MSSYALVLVVIGLAIAITRAPFVFAPARTRNTYMKLFESDGRMRALGVFVALLGCFILWGTSGVASGLAHVIYYLGWAMIIIGLGGMAIFPASLRPLALRALGSFSEPVLRLLGALAVTVGVLLAAYGMSL